MNKVIHYCWFGGAPLPQSAIKCIDSWRRFFPDYEIRRWDESNFDVNCNPYCADAYSRRKFAFVSDFARFRILYDEGGLYFDTDVEVIASMDDLIDLGPFMGIEKSHTSIGVNPGLGLAAEKGLPLYKEVLDYYSNLAFSDQNGNQLPGTVVTHVTNVLSRHGFVAEDRRQQCAGIIIYPSDFFNPLDDATGKIIKTPNTRSIHWYSKTWCDNYGPVRTRLTRLAHRLLGVDTLDRVLRSLRLR